ncbi:glycosyltransferase family 9 protein [Caldimonas brevitalea]|uniref:ADP-heptose--lipooligosaccharide heptosyltransferase II n=1 Tax=Caldimonas brevitalea TaxID=413882 RepID=A0A0G3BDM3_9BURK|nr:glycosyltransferase family 9 protein [Caldimonas brevitalea]AKJ27514.1 ADP-heptose--lipooligosaccharide heptosyltransferase II [Caldimonas brevitalea]
MNARRPSGLFCGLGAPVDDVRSIAVLRANAVGDFVLTLPALEALRSAYPDARITLLGRAWHAAFLAGRPSPVDEVVVVPPTAGVTVAPGAAEDLPAQSAFFAEMQARRFDIALQLHGGGRYSNPFVRRLQARVDAGFQATDATPLMRTLPYRESHPEALRLLEGVALVGAYGCDIEPRLIATPRDRAEAHAALPPTAGRPLVVLQPGASDPRRCWSPAHFAAVGDHFAQLGADVAINGTDAEGDAVQAVLQGMRQRARAHDLTGRLSLGGLMGLLARARLLVSNDTGPAHLARAVGTPTTVIYWIGNVQGYGPLSSARHATAVSWRLECPACGRNCLGVDCGHPDSFVDDVRPEAVIALAQPLFEAPPPLDAMPQETRPDPAHRRLA